MCVHVRRGKRSICDLNLAEDPQSVAQLSVLVLSLPNQRKVPNRARQKENRVDGCRDRRDRGPFRRFHLRA